MQCPEESRLEIMVIESDQREAACPGKGAQQRRENGAAQSGKDLARDIKNMTIW